MTPPAWSGRGDPSTIRSVVDAPVDAEPGSARWWAAHLDRLRRRRPRAGGLTVERVADEAIRLVDADGIEALTVRELTARLGTSSATLYRHVASVDELLVLVIDRVLGEIELPAPALGGRERVVRLSLEFRRVLREHPGVVPALRAAPLLGPNAMRCASNGLANLIDAGYAPKVAVPAYLALIDYVLGSVFFDTAGMGARSGVSRRDVAGSELERHRAHFEGVSSDQVFRFGLEAFLDGLDVTVAR